MSQPVGSKTAAELFEGGVPRGTREKLLFAALDLFYTHGFHAVGLDRVIAEVGVTKTTFYNHFESRDDLVREAIELRDAWESEVFTRRVQERAGFDPKKMPLALFDVLDEWFTERDYKGCLFINACAEFPNPADPIHKAGARHIIQSEETIRKVAEAAGMPDPEAFAKEWTVLLQGAVTYRLVTGDDGAAKTSRRIAERVLAVHLGDADVPTG